MTQFLHSRIRLASLLDNDDEAYQYVPMWEGVSGQIRQDHEADTDREMDLRAAVPAPQVNGKDRQAAGIPSMLWERLFVGE